MATDRSSHSLKIRYCSGWGEAKQDLFTDDVGGEYMYKDIGLTVIKSYIVCCKQKNKERK